MSITKREQQILDSIVVSSENDPLHPDFPPGNPKFPATLTYKIQVPRLTNVWLKDESVNETGTHKDRMAWEILKIYHSILLTKQNGQLQGRTIAQAVILSNQQVSPLTRKGQDKGKD
jgi:hypothetical protein